MDEHAPSSEESLLREALELAPDAEVGMVSREPLGDGSVAGFEVRAAGEPSLTYFVDTSRRPVMHETGLVAGSSDAIDARVWLHPADPHLPALAAVAFAHAAETLLARLGLQPEGVPLMVAYRPGRRAVLRIAVLGDVCWLKVVRPSRVARIVAIHRELAARGVPVPAVRGWSEEGLLVLEDARGVPAPEAEWEPEALLDEVDRLRAAFAAVPFAHAARTDLRHRLDWYAERLRVALDQRRAALLDVLERRTRDSWGEGDAAAIHGDLHFGQLFLDAHGCIAAVVDVDTAGIGCRDDDAAAFLSHAIASAALTPSDRGGRVWELARSALRRWDDGSSGGLRSRTVIHLIGHALAAWEMGAAGRTELLLSGATSVLDGDADALGRP